MGKEPKKKDRGFVATTPIRAVPGPIVPTEVVPPADEEEDDDQDSLVLAAKGLRVAASQTPPRLGQYLTRPKRLREDEGSDSPTPSTSTKRKKSTNADLKEAINQLAVGHQQILATLQRVEAMVAKLADDRTPRAVQGPVFPPLLSATQVPPTRIITSGTSSGQTPGSAVAHANTDNATTSTGPSGLTSAGQDECF